MQALEIIQAEHRGMWRLTSAMDALGRSIEADPQTHRASAGAIAEMLDYLDGYIDTVHHPKEDEHLFRALQRHDHRVGDAMAQLQQEHRDGPVQRDALRRAARAVACGDAHRSGELAHAVADYTATLRAHIRLEETAVMPEARRLLTTEDWQAIDAAFADNEDPLFGKKVRAEMQALKARVVALTPAPMGLGATEVAYAAPIPEQAPVGVLSGAPGEVVLCLRAITSHYGRIQALHGLDLDVRRGQLVALVGANGAGKTTLLRAISGVQPISKGRIEFSGVDITRLAPDRRVRLGICQVPEGRQVFGPMKIEDNLRLGAYVRRDQAGIASDLARVYALFPVLHEKRALPAGLLSGGQQQMLAMGRALMGRPQLLLLDEPSMGLAPLLVEEIFRVVQQLRGEGITIFLVEQNAHAALSIADVGYVIETGHTVLSGPGPELLRNPQVQAAYLGM